VHATRIQLPEDPSDALRRLRERSREAPVVVFKKSPTCPVSHVAEAEFDRWVSRLESVVPLEIAVVDVLERRGLARGLTRELGIPHESPQALLFFEGRLVWHDSHGTLTHARFQEELDRAR